MALRPVSELGLVDVTDVATPAAAAPRRKRKPPTPTPTKRRSGARGPRGSSPPPSEDQETAGSRGAGMAASVLSGAIGVAGAVLVGRAILGR
jgi:hypothetical protein